MVPSTKYVNRASKLKMMKKALEVRRLRLFLIRPHTPNEAGGAAKGAKLQAAN